MIEIANHNQRTTRFPHHSQRIADVASAATRNASASLLFHAEQRRYCPLKTPQDQKNASRRGGGDDLMTVEENDSFLNRFRRYNGLLDQIENGNNDDDYDDDDNQEDEVRGYCDSFHSLPATLDVSHGSHFTTSDHSLPSDERNHHRQPLTGVSSSPHWRRPGAQLRADLLVQDQSKRSLFNEEEEQLLSRASWDTYIDRARQTYDKFLQHPVDTGEELFQAYLVGSRLEEFLEDTFPKHPNYQPHPEWQQKLDMVQLYLEKIALLIDQETYQEYVLDMLNKNTDEGSVDTGLNSTLTTTTDMFCSEVPLGQRTMPPPPPSLLDQTMKKLQLDHSGTPRMDNRRPLGNYPINRLHPRDDDQVAPRIVKASTSLRIQTSPSQLQAALLGPSLPHTASTGSTSAKSTTTMRLQLDQSPSYPPSSPDTSSTTSTNSSVSPNLMVSVDDVSLQLSVDGGMHTFTGRRIYSPSMLDDSYSLGISHDNPSMDAISLASDLFEYDTEKQQRISNGGVNESSYQTSLSHAPTLRKGKQSASPKFNPYESALDPADDCVPLVSPESQSSTSSTFRFHNDEIGSAGKCPTKVTSSSSSSSSCASRSISSRNSIVNQPRTTSVPNTRERFDPFDFRSSHIDIDLLRDSPEVVKISAKSGSSSTFAALLPPRPPRPSLITPRALLDTPSTTAGLVGSSMYEINSPATEPSPAPPQMLPEPVPTIVCSSDARCTRLAAEMENGVYDKSMEPTISRHTTTTATTILSSHSSRSGSGGNSSEGGDSSRSQDASRARSVNSSQLPSVAPAPPAPPQDFEIVQNINIIRTMSGLPATPSSPTPSNIEVSPRVTHLNHGRNLICGGNLADQDIRPTYIQDSSFALNDTFSPLPSPLMSAGNLLDQDELDRDVTFFHEDVSIEEGSQAVEVRPSRMATIPVRAEHTHAEDRPPIPRPVSMLRGGRERSLPQPSRNLMVAPQQRQQSIGSVRSSNHSVGSMNSSRSNRSRNSGYGYHSSSTNRSVSMASGIYGFPQNDRRRDEAVARIMQRMESVASSLSSNVVVPVDDNELYDEQPTLACDDSFHWAQQHKPTAATQAYSLSSSRNENPNDDDTANGDGSSKGRKRFTSKFRSCVKFLLV